MSIKDIGKTSERLDPEMVAKALGATIVGRISRGGSMIKIHRDDREVDIPELAKEALKDYEVLGTALGADKYHCVYLGANYGKDFWKRVAGYWEQPASEEEVKKGFAVSVTFYSKKA